MSEKALLGDIMCPDRGKNEEFSPEAKAAIFALCHTGMSKRAVARQFKTDHRTVDRIIKRVVKSGTFDGNTRTGRPSKLNRAERRNILSQNHSTRRILPLQEKMEVNGQTEAR
jgi:transposase